MLCASIILPITPPELFEAAARSGEKPSCWAEICCRFPNNTLEEVSLPVNATPSQPSIGEKKGNKAPVLANARPIVASRPPNRVVNPNASIAAIVSSDKRTRLSVPQKVRARVAGPSPSSSPEMIPDRSNAVPVAETGGGPNGLTYDHTTGDQLWDGDKVTDRAIEYLSSLPPGGRYATWVHYLDPHEPRKKMAPFDFGDSSSDKYDTEVAFADREVGRLLDWLRDSGRIFMEAAPRGLDPEQIGQTLAAEDGVVEVHDLHVWEVTSGFPALAAHVLVAPGDDCHAVRRQLQAMVGERFDIAHVTLQVDHAPAGDQLLDIEPRR